MTLEKLKELLNEKKKNTLSDLDKEKVSLIERLFEDDQIFFHLEYTTAIGILRYLGIPEEKLKSVHMELISYDNFKTDNDTYSLVEPDDIIK